MLLVPACAVQTALPGVKPTSSVNRNNERRQHPMTDNPYHITLAGVDTFIVNYKYANEQGILTGDSLPDHIQDELDAWQKTARKEQTPIPTSLTFSYDIRPEETVNQTLFIRSHGSSVWSWMLYSDDVLV